LGGLPLVRKALRRSGLQLSLIKRKKGLTQRGKCSSIYGMIKIVKNVNFPQFLEIFNDSTLIEEVQGRAKALRIAKKLARKEGLSFFLFEDKMVDTNS
jgi:hypothetical protein